MPDYVPTTDDALVTWLVNLQTKLPGYATALGIDSTRMTAINGETTALITAIQNNGQAKESWLAASAAKQATANTTLTALRAEINQWKTSPAITTAMIADLQIVGSSSAFNPETYQATLTAQVFTGYVRFKFKKGQTDGINLYSRIKGQTAWKFVSRDTNSPYDDHTPAATPGTPEVREYQAFGVLNDQQIGQPSDIVAVTVAG